MKSTPIVAYKEITPEIASAWWARYNDLSGNEDAEQRMLGKILVWCKNHFGKGTTQGIIRREYGVEIDEHTYAAGKVFRAVLSGRFPSFTEKEYDSLPTNLLVNEISPKLAKLTDAEIGKLVSGGVDVRFRLRRRSKDPNHPKRGCIYVMVASAEPECCKLGGTLDADPYRRAKGINSRTGTMPAARVVPVWWAEVYDWKLAETALQEPFTHLGGETFSVRAKEAIDHAFLVARKYALLE